MNCITNTLKSGAWVASGLVTDTAETTVYCAGLWWKKVEDIGNFITAENPYEENFCLKWPYEVVKMITAIFTLVVVMPATLVGGVFCIPSLFFIRYEKTPEDLRGAIDEFKVLKEMTRGSFQGEKTCGKRFIDSYNFTTKDQFLPALECWIPSDQVVSDSTYPRPEASMLEVVFEESSSSVLFPTEVESSQTFIDKLKKQRMDRLSALIGVQGLQKKTLEDVQVRAGRFSLFPIPGKEKITAFCREKLQNLNVGTHDTMSGLKPLYTKEDLELLRRDIGLV